jgi:hypothetical protein
MRFGRQAAATDREWLSPDEPFRRRHRRSRVGSPPNVVKLWPPPNCARDSDADLGTHSLAQYWVASFSAMPLNALRGRRNVRV